MPANRSSSISTGAAIMVAMRWFDRLVGVVSTLVLARLLLPHDFGIIAMASIVVGFIDIIFDLGVSVAVIQRKAPTQAFYDTAWTLRIVQSCMVALLLVLVAPFAADYYHDPRVTAAIQVMALSIAIAAFENIGIVNFQKDLNFAADARFMLSKRLMAFVITIALTLVLRNYWGMIIGVLCARLFSTGLSYAVHPMRPRWSLVHFKDIFSISQWVLVKNISQYLDRNLHVILVGGTTTTGITGGYTLANEIADVPGSDLLAPINRVLFPAFARVKDDLAELTRLLLMAQSVQVMVTFPACIGFVMTAHQFVPVALGERWLFIVPFIQTLALSNIIQAMCSSANYVLTVIGQIRVLALSSWVQILLFSMGLLLCRSVLDAELIAKIRFGAIVLTFLFSYYILTRYLPTVSIRLMLRGVLRPALGCAGIVAALAAIDELAGPMPLALLLAIKVVVGVLVYCALVVSLWALAGRPGGAERYILDKLGLFNRQSKQSP